MRFTMGRRAAVIIGIALVFVVGVFFYWSQRNTHGRKNWILVENGDTNSKVITFDDFNMYCLDFEKIILKIKDELDISSISKVDTLEITYENDGSIRDFLMRLVNKQKNYFNLYYLTYDRKENVCRVYFDKSGDLLEYDRMSDELAFIKNMKKLDFLKLNSETANQNFDVYVLRLNRNGCCYETNENYNAYVVENNQVRKTSETETVDGFAITVIGEKNAEKTAESGRKCMSVYIIR